MQNTRTITALLVLKNRPLALLFIVVHFLITRMSIFSIQTKSQHGFVGKSVISKENIYATDLKIELCEESSLKSNDELLTN